METQVQASGGFLGSQAAASSQVPFPGSPVCSTCPGPTPADPRAPSIQAQRPPRSPLPGSPPPGEDRRLPAEGPPSAQAPRPLTRYLPSGENLQSRLESLNASEKFMAAAGPHDRETQPAATAPPRPEVTEDERRSQSGLRADACIVGLVVRHPAPRAPPRLKGDAAFCPTRDFRRCSGVGKSPSARVVR